MKPIYYLLTIIIFFACEEDKKSQSPGYPVNSISVLTELDQLSKIEWMPQYRPGLVKQISSYDTTGGNNDGFSGIYSYIRKEGNKLLISDLKGPGVIYRIWTPTPTQDTLQFYFDGEPDPRISIRFIDLFSGKVFPFLNPFVGNEVGGYFCYLPIPFQHSCKIYYCGSSIMFHQIQYRIFPDSTKTESFPRIWPELYKNYLNETIKSWDQNYNQINNNLINTYPDLKLVNKTIQLEPGESKVIFKTGKGGRIVFIGIGPAGVFTGNFRDILIETHWDDETVPAISCPVADFFGYAFGVPSMHGRIAGSEEDNNYCFIPMPFDSKAEISLTYLKRDSMQKPVDIKSGISYSSVKRNVSMEGKFYANWKRENPVKNGNPYIFLHTTGRGHYIGSILLAQGLIAGMTRFFEGDDSTVVDGEMRLHGTGSEDYFNGGWYALPDRWDRAFSLPLHGCLGYSIPYSRTGGYRFYMSDKISFEKSILQTIEHGPEGNHYPADYTSIAYYYCSQPPAYTLTPDINNTGIYLPDTFSLSPELMKITIGLGMKVEYPDWGVAEFSGRDRGNIRIELDELPFGKYAMFITYYNEPDGAGFSIWQRQKQISGIKSARSDRESLIKDLEIGEIIIDGFNNTVTIIIEPPVTKTLLKIRGLSFVRKSKNSI